jgi:peptidoglycan DL-endopeptidase CwlO
MPGNRTRRTAVAAAVITAASALMPQAAAQPSQSDALAKYNDVTRQAEELNQQHLKAQDDLKAKQGELDKANSDLQKAGQVADAAKADEEQFRGRVDVLTEASFEGARLNQLSALLVSDSQQDFLNRMSAMSMLVADNNEAMQKLSAALDAAQQAQASAQDAQKRAAEATDGAAKLVNDIAGKKSAMDQQVTTARNQYQSLTGAQKATLSNPGDQSPVNVPAGAAGAALNFALAQRGEPYVFGANGPNQWDCSSLMQQAYKAAGVNIPRTTYDQAKLGRAVTRAQVAPGDLVIYYSGQSHVAMVVDNVRAVHASTEGVPVKIADIDSIGPISVIRRVVG